MTQITVFGGLGYGKTMFMVFMAYLCSKLRYSRLAAMANKRDPFFPISVPEGKENEVTPVIANFPIALPNCSYVKVDEFLEYEGDPFHKTVALIDEAKDWGVDARRSSRKVALALSSYFTQSRKAGVDIVVGTQLNSMIDKRLRGLAQITIWAVRPDPYRFNYRIADSAEADYNYSLSKSFCAKTLVPLFASHRRIFEEYSDETEEEPRS